MISKAVVLPLCASLCAIQNAGYANDAVSVHPIVGHKTPNELLAKDILALPQNERLAWIHGAISLMAITAASKERGLGRCVMDWYFSVENSPRVLIDTMNKYPEERAASLLFGLVGLTCKGL